MKLKMKLNTKLTIHMLQVWRFIYSARRKETKSKDEAKYEAK